MSDLLKESLADAKVVMATATANAKIALEEAFGERIQAMFAERLRNEVASEEGATEEAVDTSNIGKDHGNVPAKQHPVKPAHQDKTVKGSQKFDAHLEEEMEEEGHHTADPGAAAGHVSGTAEEGSEEITDEDLEEIIAELEKEVSEEGDAAPADPAPAPVPAPVDATAAPAPVAAPTECPPAAPVPTPVDATAAPAPAPAPVDTTATPAPAPVADVAPTAEAEEDESIDLEELLAELEQEGGEEQGEEESVEEGACSECSEVESQLETVTKDRDEAYKTVEILRSQLNEVNLLNAKLLYTNKLFKQFSLNNDQKMKVVENFDLTTSVREVKLTYAIMAESFNLGGSVVKKKNTNATTITEGLASKPVASTKPAQEIVSGGNKMAERFKTLAGIK